MGGGTDALLTPLGSVQLLESQPLAEVPRILARVDQLLDPQLTRQLESDIALAATLDDKRHAFAAWLEVRATAQRRISRAALRAGRAAMRVCAMPALSMEAIADEQHVSRRQIERDFRHWIGTSPRP
jgi:transcriptional regulator GlxA family with amidase domain